MRRWEVILLAILSAAGNAAAQTPRPNTKTLNCATAECHTKQLDHKFLHGPTAVQACDVCHEYTDPVVHTFHLKREGKDLCIFCHIDKAGTEGKFVHKPVGDGQCLGCHDPHGSAIKPMLKKDTVPQQCAECHKDVLKGSHIHKPAGEDCSACHKSHTSDHERLLIAEKRDLCITCHADVGKTASGSAHPHQPAQGDCLQCHAPHASDQERVLKAAPAELCSSCHKDVGAATQAASHKHTPVLEGKACLNCHTPHGSEHGKQLKDDPAAACLACHNKPIQIDKDRKVAPVPEVLQAGFIRHGPVAQGDCAACHTVHGGTLDKLLVKPYSAAFYQPFSEDAYALCFKCHDKNLVLSDKAGQETNFRDGARNLHFVHVKGGGVQGRSCRACHAPHASHFNTQIADSVQFGQWNLPINYKQTETGGSCAPGCHKPYAYDRGGPAAKPNMVNQPGTTSATPPPPAGEPGR